MSKVYIRRKEGNRTDYSKLTKMQKKVTVRNTGARTSADISKLLDQIQVYRKFLRLDLRIEIYPSSFLP